jgi:hypothetical protein
MNVVPVGPKAFLFVGAVALSGIVAGMVSAGREPQPALAQFAKLIQPPIFDERWDDAMAEAPMPKQDRLAVKGDDPQPVKVEKIALAEPVKAESKPSKKSLREGPCEKGKRWTRGGRSWRCRR